MTVVCTKINLGWKGLNNFKVKKREKGSGIRVATGRVNNREVEGRKAGRRKKEWS